MKIPSFEKRLGKILSHLESQQGKGEGDPHELLANAYRWFFSTSRHDSDAPVPENWAEYHIANYESFDAILSGQSVYRSNEIQWARQRRASQDAQRRGQEVLGTPASRVSISPHFDDMYVQVPKHIQGKVAEKLKSLSLSTRNQDQFKRLLSVRDGVTFIEVAPGVDLVAEMEGRIGVCFLGFRFQALRRPSASDSHWLSRVAFGGLAIMVGILITSLLIVPYDVIMAGNGPRAQVFVGYTPVWSNPDIHRICGLYLEQELEPGSAFRNCYSSISLPRAALSSGAAMVLVFSFLGLLRLKRRRKEG